MLILFNISLTKFNHRQNILFHQLPVGKGKIEHMTNFLLVSDLTDAFQNFSGQMIFSTLENLIIFIFVASGLFLIVSTPVAFLVSAFDNFFKQMKLKKDIDTSVFAAAKKTHFSYDQKVCQDFIQTFSNCLSSIFALMVWTLSSAAYIIFYIGDSISGVASYFKFPFDILASYDFNNSVLIIKNYESNWYFMLGIFIITIFAYQIGKGFAPLLVEKYITDKSKKVSYA